MTTPQDPIVVTALAEFVETLSCLGDGGNLLAMAVVKVFSERIERGDAWGDVVGEVGTRIKYEIYAIGEVTSTPSALDEHHAVIESFRALWCHIMFQDMVTFNGLHEDLS